MNPERYSFCETLAAMGAWHIRLLTDKGKKLTGGADTETLCGVKAAWDVNCEITEVTLDTPPSEPGHPCEGCKKKYREATQ